MLVDLVLAALAAGSVTASAGDAQLRPLADKCGSQIAWIRDAAPTDDGGTQFVYTRDGKKLNRDQLEQAELPALALRERIGEALSRAKQEQRLVLWHVWRLEGPQMYRAPLLDDYMDQIFWTDPEVVALVNDHFVPLRTRLSAEVGKDFGITAWDSVEPALVLLTPDGKVAHKIDRIRTFDPHWLAVVLKRVLASHSDLNPPDPKPSAADSFTTPDATELEATRNAYYESLEAWYSGKDDAALAGWQKLADGHPTSPFAWRAAANLLKSPDTTPAGAARHAFEAPVQCWLPVDGAIPTDTRWRRKPADAESVAENAVRWLLRAQRADGSWNDCRYAYWDSPVITPNAWMAITALSASALAEWRDLAPEEIDDALGRAESYLFSGGRVNAGKNEECYADAYRILYLERVLAQTEDKQQRGGLKQRIGELCAALAGLQRPSGQWAHEYDNAFCSAVALDALWRAKAAGVEVPKAAVDHGIDGILAARFADGTYSYGGGGVKGKPGPQGDDHFKDSCGRMPVCEAALFAWGKSDAKAVAKALAVYQQYFDRFEKISKCDFHTDGELGGFFFFHDLFHSAEAMKRLPAAAQKPMRGWFVEKITALPEIDGSFIDDHELGKSGSTAFALLALKTATANETH